jgi:cytochrome c oxidase subunit 2
MLDQLVPSASSFAGDIDQLFLIICLVVGVWFVMAEVMFFWLIFRFRARDGVKARYITGKEKDLKRWITVPHNLILVFDVLIIVLAIRVWVHVKQTLPPADSTVRVVAQQWAWTFQDPGADNTLDTADDIRTTDVQHLEVGKTYHFLLDSKDVLHSYFIPAFRLKHDAVPGRIHTGWYKPTKAGDYEILCAEICGIGHGVMGAKLVVQTPEAHAEWIAANTPADALAADATTTEGDPAAGAPTDSTSAAAGTH